MDKKKQDFFFYLIEKKYYQKLNCWNKILYYRKKIYLFHVENHMFQF